ncbi:MAG: hypothetical protein V1820_04465 [archaeon]
MTLIYETENFAVEAPEKPHIDRDDGGHIKILPKVRVRNRWDLPPKLAVEVMRISCIVGAAMTRALNARGVDIGRVNFQDMGNWSVFSPEGPFFHMHVYGRAKSAKVQKYGEAVFLPKREDKPGFYRDFKPLTEEDCQAIRREIERLLREEKYQEKNWKI